MMSTRSLCHERRIELTHPVLLSAGVLRERLANTHNGNLPSEVILDFPRFDRIRGMIFYDRVKLCREIVSRAKSRTPKGHLRLIPILRSCESDK